MADLQNAIGMMTLEEALAVAAFLPEPPADTRLCWTDWDASWQGASMTVSRSAFLFDLRYHGGTVLRKFVVMREWDMRRMGRAKLVAEAYRRMAQVEEAVVLTVPVYVAEGIVKQARDSSAEAERRGPEGFDYR